MRWPNLYQGLFSNYPLHCQMWESQQAEVTAELLALIIRGNQLDPLQCCCFSLQPRVEPEANRTINEDMA